MKDALTLAATLREATSEAQRHNDLPDYLAQRTVAIADRLAGREDVSEEIEDLIEQVRLYDTYGQTGYLGMGVNHLILEKTVARVEDRLRE